MAHCPAKTPEWLHNVAVLGQVEAYRDYIETDGEVRDPDVILQKLHDRKVEDNRLSGINYIPDLNAKHNLGDIVEDDGKVDWDGFDKLQNEFFNRETGITLKDRPEHHDGEKTTWDHIQNVVKTAQTVDLPEGVDRKTLVMAALLHDIGKPYRNEDHSIDSVNVTNTLFKDATSEVKLAVRYHMLPEDATVEDYENMINDAVGLGIDPKKFGDLLMTLNKVDIIRNRDLKDIDPVTHKSVEETVNEEENNKRQLYRAALEEPQVDSLLLKPDEFYGNVETDYGDNLDDAEDKLTVDGLKNARAVELAGKMTDAMGVEYNEVSAEEMDELTKDSPNPRTNQAACFYNGKVYFVRDRMTSDMVLHEYAHPLIRSIIRENPELFDNLYQKLGETSEGQNVIAAAQKMYDGVDHENNIFKEEALVMALEKAASEKYAGRELDGKFKKWIDNLLYQFKQLFRKVFGQKIQISKLDSTTTLDKLADILTEGGKIKIDTKLLSEDDLVAYRNENHKEITEDVMSMDEEVLKHMTNNLFDRTVSHLNMLLKNKNYEELAPLLTDEYNRGDLQAMRSNLTKWQTNVRDAAERLVYTLQENKNRAQAVTSTLFRLKSVMEKMNKHVELVSTRPDTQENVDKAFYYGRFVKSWESFTYGFKEAIADSTNHVPADSPLRKVIDDIDSNARSINQYLKKMNADASRDALYEKLKPIYDGIKVTYDEMMDKLRKSDKPYAKKKLAQVFKEFNGMSEEELSEYNKIIAMKKAGEYIGPTMEARRKTLTSMSMQGLSFSKDKIEGMFLEHIGDAKWYNHFFEGWLSNSDPIVGGLGLYVKDALTDVMTRVQQNSNLFADDIKQDLHDIKFNPMMIGGLGKQLWFQDMRPVRNFDIKDKVVFEQKPVWSFLHEFQNHQWVAHTYKQAKDDAYLAWEDSRTDENHEIWAKAVNDEKIFKRTWMYQENTPAFYERDAIFRQIAGSPDGKDRIGDLAMAKREDLFMRLRMIGEMNTSQTDDLLDADAIDLAWRDYRQMPSMCNLDGTLKTGDEAEIAARLRAYRDASKDLYDLKLRQGVFENAYFAYQDELRAANVPEFVTLADGTQETTVAWKDAMDLWKKRNTRKAIKPESYKEREQILTQIKAIMSKLPSTVQKDIDQTKVWEQINALTSPFRGNDGQIIGTDIDPGAVTKIKELQEELDAIKKRALSRDGLTGTERTEYWDLFNAQRNGQGTMKGALRLNELTQKKATMGLNKQDVAILDGLYEDLGNLSYKEATMYYTDIMNHWMSELNSKEFFEKNAMKNVDTLNADIFLHPKVAEYFMKQNPEFKKWFEANHMLTETYIKGVGSTPEYERLHIWNVIKPNDPAMMESYEIRDPDDNHVIDTVEGLPSTNYYGRTPKLKYKTRNIPGVTKDNMGNFLPKSRAEMAKATDVSEDTRYQFINEKYEAIQKDPAQFKLLEKLKRYYLSWQEGLPKSSKLYYDAPRERKSMLELIESGNFKDRLKHVGTPLTIFAKRAKEFIMGGVSDYEHGYINNDTRNTLQQAEIFDDDAMNIPMGGIYNVPINDVSTDCITSMLKYMQHAEYQKKLIEISPIVRAIQESVSEIAGSKNPNIFQKYYAKLLERDPSMKSIRRISINAKIEREFEGKTQANDRIPLVAKKVMTLFFKKASFAFFALNTMSALKDSYTTKFQGMMEASAGKYLDHLSLQQGNLKSAILMAEQTLPGYLYGRGGRSFNMQFMHLWDMGQGEYTTKMGEHVSRTFLKDVVGTSWLYSFRNSVRQQANVQVYCGMLYHQKLMRTMPDGTSKQIPYMDAFEMRDGVIKLKDGIDVRYAGEPTFHHVSVDDTYESIAAKYHTTPQVIEEALNGSTLDAKRQAVTDLEETRELKLAEVAKDEAKARLDPNNSPETMIKLMDRRDAINKKYDALVQDKGSIKIDNSLFKLMKNRAHQVTNNLQGAFAKFDQPEAQRYMLFRAIIFMKRFFTPMLMNRLAFDGPIWNPRPRLNPGMGDTQFGFYVQSMQILFRTLTSMGRNIAFLTKPELQAFKKFGSEAIGLVAIDLITRFAFGYTDDDKDLIKKLKAKSGPLPNPFSSASSNADDGREFHLEGWLELQLLHLLLELRVRNEQFNVLPYLSGGRGMSQYTSFLDLKSLALGPNTDAFNQMYVDTQNYLEGNPAGRYKRDVGPYMWSTGDENNTGSPKIWNHFFKSFGFTGTFVDPVLGIQALKTFGAAGRERTQ